MQGVENNKVNKWVLWVNNLKQIGKNPQAISLHQSGASINHHPKIFTDFFFFLSGNWKWTFLANLQYSFVWKSLPLLQCWCSSQSPDKAAVMLTAAFSPPWSKLRAGEGRRHAQGVTQILQESQNRDSSSFECSDGSSKIAAWLLSSWTWKLSKLSHLPS